ncbi:MAG: hypothetical protein KF778_20935 [Rhodocyclaceae bacterium]|nr:hypothetical protein [Rhodocyclaceae bacterium]MBX3670872.1 hypothetical protein [Rhodocyclaceae bacterium]
MRALAATAVATLAALPAAARAAESARAQGQFAWLQQLEGDWVLAADQDSEAAKHPVIAPLVGSGTVALRYRLVGSRTTLQENIFPGTPREMATMYHCVDKACSQVMADHYCSLRNQPVLRAAPPTAPGQLVFQCDPAVAVCASPDAHLDRLTVERLEGSANQLKTSFSIRKDGKIADLLVFHFERRK